MAINAIIPHLTVDKGSEAIAFYERAFGAEREHQVPAEDGKRLLHASLLIDGQRFMLVDHFPEYSEGGGAPPATTGETTVTVHLECDDADALFQRALQAGASELMPLQNAFWGARYGRLRDPFGHIWSIGGPLKE